MFSGMIILPYSKGKISKKMRGEGGKKGEGKKRRERGRSDPLGALYFVNLLPFLLKRRRSCRVKKKEKEKEKRI